MNPKYEQEIHEFQRNFVKLHEQDIVLYGIGRYTATLIEGLSGFNIIGLMDKDPANIGKKYFGLRVLSVDEAKAKADAIIINTAATYWRLIYQRIKDVGLPVYCRNGQRAEYMEVEDSNDPYWDSSLEDLQKKISRADVVSFDFYDTLFSRVLCNPKDVFCLMDYVVSKQFPEIQSGQWAELRSRAVGKMPLNYNLDELYVEISSMGNLRREDALQIKQMELDLEACLLVPRKPLLQCLKTVLRDRKEVYVLSDMYLPKSFFQEILKHYGINLPLENIQVSAVSRKSKSDGALWQEYRAQIGDKKAIHIGDNLESDIQEPRKHGIEVYYVANVMDLLQKSSLRKISSHICTTDASMNMGKIISRMFENPFVLNKSRGRIRLQSNFEMGYYVFGPVLLTFFRWLMRQVRQDGVKRLVFLARDGYFMQKDFERFLLHGNNTLETCYIGISRQLAMTAAVQSEQDIENLLDMPYTGTFGELLEDRFGILDAEEAERAEWRKYLPNIKEYVQDIQARYKRYLEKFQLNEQDAIVDLGYYGNNQRYLNAIIGKHMRGYYFNANCSSGNHNTKLQVMVPCFQEADDETGKNSGILKYQIFLESFLTAPYGMVEDIAEDGSLICKKKMQNQLHFAEKEKINEGVKAWIDESMRVVHGFDVEEDRKFADEYYQACFEGGIEFSDEIKSSFFNDNAMMNRLESSLFY